MTSFEEYCPLCEGGLLASGGLLAGGGYACAAPRDEGQNEKGGPHHSLHRVLHSRESCSTVTDEIVWIQYLLPHEPRAPREQ